MNSMRILSTISRTDDDVSAAAARLALGAMILPHGLQKVFGWFGGYGFEGTMAFFTEGMGIPWLLALAAIGAESVGGVALLLGLGGRVAALAVGSVMVVAAATSHVGHGFFMNWSGTLPAGSEGWEFHLLAVGLAVVVLIRGSGALSVDRALATWSGRELFGGPEVQRVPEAARPGLAALESQVRPQRAPISAEMLMSDRHADIVKPGVSKETGARARAQGSARS